MATAIAEPSVTTALPGLEFWHLGAVVADMEVALATERALGALACSKVARLDCMTWDAINRELVREVFDVAWVRHGVGNVELIAPVTGQGPQARLLRERAHASHRAYWCDDMIASARAVAAIGGEFYLAPLLPGEGVPAMIDWSLDQILCVSQACYFRLPGGAIIELNGRAGQPGMKLMWGDEVGAILGFDQA